MRRRSTCEENVPAVVSEPGRGDGPRAKAVMHASCVSDLAVRAVIRSITSEQSKVYVALRWQQMAVSKLDSMPHRTWYLCS